MSCVFFFSFLDINTPPPPAHRGTPGFQQLHQLQFFRNFLTAAPPPRHLLSDNIVIIVVNKQSLRSFLSSARAPAFPSQEKGLNEGPCQI